MPPLGAAVLDLLEVGVGDLLLGREWRWGRAAVAARYLFKFDIFAHGGIDFLATGGPACERSRCALGGGAARKAAPEILLLALHPAHLPEEAYCRQKKIYKAGYGYKYKECTHLWKRELTDVNRGFAPRERL